MIKYKWGHLLLLLKILISNVDMLFFEDSIQKKIWKKYQGFYKIIKGLVHFLNKNVLIIYLPQVHYMDKNPGMFYVISFWLKRERH